MNLTHFHFKIFLLCLVSFSLLLTTSSCKKKGIERPQGEYIPPPKEEDSENPNEENEENTGQEIFPNIDLNNWKVTLPVGNPTEVAPPAILDYANNETLKPFMYNDTADGSLVFYTYPGASTANSSYSRTELREQMVPGSNSTNWTFAQGANMRGTLAMSEISTDSDNRFHRTIIMQIHGRLTNEQRDLIGEDDNNAPPILKIYWAYGYVRVKTKVLKDINASGIDILPVSAWGDDDGYTFNEYVGFDKFILEVKVEEGRMEVILNDNESVVYDDIHIQKWGIFENYFKAGNYLASKDEGSFSKIKYYELEVTH
ncbi:MAG: polysaccharide lyase family 7 protein [Chitinophagales bacterium]